MGFGSHWVVILQMGRGWPRPLLSLPRFAAPYLPHRAACSARYASIYPAACMVCRLLSWRRSIDRAKRQEGGGDRTGQPLQSVPTSSPWLPPAANGSATVPEVYPALCYRGAYGVWCPWVCFSKVTPVRERGHQLRTSVSPGRMMISHAALLWSAEIKSAQTNAWCGFRAVFGRLFS